MEREMNIDNDGSRLPERLCKVVGVACNLILIAVFLSFGCATEHRIGFDQFMELQRAVSQETPADPVGSEAGVPDLDANLGPYRIGPSDVVSVSWVGGAGVPPALDARVDGAGTIELPFVGTVVLLDKTLEEAEDQIHDAYVPAVFQDAVVYVNLLEPHTTNVFVVGAVSHPGLVQLRRNQRNLLFAIVGAGGAVDFASGLATLRRLRRPGESTSYDLRDPFQLRNAVGQDPLEDGDMVYVHAAKPNTVFVGGLVQRVGPQNYPAGANITILQALAAAGGLRTDVFPKKGTLVRRMPDGTDMHVMLDLGRLARGADPNIELYPGDILWVPETWETRVQNFINQNIFFRAGVSANYNVTGVEYMNRASQQSGAFRSQESISDPFGFLGQNAALRGIQGSLPQ